MAMTRTLFWHRRDLRLADNTGLQAAVALGPVVTGVYVLDPALITPPEHLPQNHTPRAGPEPKEEAPP